MKYNATAYFSTNIIVISVLFSWYCRGELGYAYLFVLLSVQSAGWHNEKSDYITYSSPHDLLTHNIF